MIKKDKNELNEMEYLVTQENGTEPPFQNEYWNHFDKGIYCLLYTSDAADE